MHAVITLVVWTRGIHVHVQTKLSNIEKSSVGYPDPHGFPLILAGWIRIRMKVGKNDPKKKKSEERYCFEVLYVLLGRLDDLRGGLGINIVQFLKKMSFFQL